MDSGTPLATIGAMPSRSLPPMVRGRLVAAAWALLAADGSQAQPIETSPALSLLPASDPGLRSDVAWLVDRGVIELPLGTWPLPSSTLRAAWADVDAGRLAAADADALARVQRAVARSTDTARLRMGVNSARHPSLDGGAVAQGIASGSLLFYAGNAQVGGQLALGATAQNLAPDGPQGNLDGSYLAAQFDNVVVAAGAVDRWWGPGHYASPILSDAAAPIAGVLVRRAVDHAPQGPLLGWIGRWGYEFSVGRLNHYEPSGTRVIGLRLYTRPWPNVEIGLARAMMWAGEGRPHDWVALRDAILGRSNIDDPEQKGDDPSNEIAGFDLRASADDPWGGTLVGSVHLVGEDEAASLPTKLFGTIGLQRKSVVNAQRLELTLEATDTMPRHLFGLRTSDPPPAYQHSIYQQGYYQGQLPIGATIGGGGTLYTLGLAWTRIDDPQQLRVNAVAFGGRMSEMGNQPRNAAYGVTGKLTGFALGVDGETPSGFRWRFGISMQSYVGGDRPRVGVRAGFELPIAR